MNIGKSWKTTSTGITMIAGAIVGLYFAYKSNNLNEGTIMGAVTAIIGGVGFLFSKDNNVTGGTVVNATNDPAVQATQK